MGARRLEERAGLRARLLPAVEVAACEVEPADRQRQRRADGDAHDGVSEAEHQRAPEVHGGAPLLGAAPEHPFLPGDEQRHAHDQQADEEHRDDHRRDAEVAVADADDRVALAADGRPPAE